MTFVYGSRSAETPQRRRVIFITVSRRPDVSSERLLWQEMELSRNELAALNVKYDWLSRDTGDVRSAPSHVVVYDRREWSPTGDETSMKNSRAVHDLRCNAIPERTAPPSPPLSPPSNCYPSDTSVLACAYDATSPQSTSFGEADGKKRTETRRRNTDISPLS